VNQCISSTLHKNSLQWVGNDVEKVYVDASTCIVVVDAPCFGPMILPHVSHKLIFPIISS
jgi:hypothetical protein